MISIEVKGSTNPSAHDYRGLFAFAEDFPKAKKIIVCLAENRRLTKEGIDIYPVHEFLECLWNRKIL